MRLRSLLPCALLGAALLSSCSNSRSLVAPNTLPIYRAKLVEEPAPQIVHHQRRSVPQPQMASRSIQQPQTTQRTVQIAQAPSPKPIVRTAPAPNPVPRVVVAPAAPKPVLLPTSSTSPKIGGVVRTTAYTHTEADSLQYGKKNAAGGNLKYGRVRSAAADWSVYPVGTIFKMDGDPNVYEIDDYGSALVGSKTIDIYKPSKQSMNEWGVRHVPIKVLRWGSFAKSLEILKPREYKAEHVRQMAKSIRAKGL